MIDLDVPTESYLLEPALNEVKKLLLSKNSFMLKL